MLFRRNTKIRGGQTAGFLNVTAGVAVVTAGLETVTRPRDVFKGLNWKQYDPSKVFFFLTLFEIYGSLKHV